MSGDDRRSVDSEAAGRGGWLSVRVSIPERLRGSETWPRVSAVLVELGGSAVEEIPGGLRTAVPASGGEEAVRDRLRRLLSSLAGEEGAELEVEVRREPARDWSREWRRGLAPRRLGRRLVVAPGWTDPELDDHEVLLRVDPAGAFGSGEHGTTRGALRLLERALEPGDRVLDVGTGSGILALAAVKLGASRVVALDRERAAVETARHVLERNDAEGPVELLHLEATPAVLTLFEPLRFDVITANLVSGRLYPLLKPLRGRARDGGSLVVAGILEREAEGMREAAGDAGWRVVARNRDEGWWSALLRA